MTLRTHKIEKKNEQNNQEWSWEETPEVIAAIEQLQKSSEAVKAVSYKPRPLYVGTKNYAPLKKSVVK